MSNQSTHATDRNLNEQISTQAASWLAQLDSGRLSTADRLALAEWMSRSPKHAEELKRLAALWGSLDQVIDAIAEPEYKAARTGSLLGGVTAAGFSTQPLRTSTLALLPLMLICAVALMFYVNNEPSQPLSPMIATYQTDIGENQEITLDDGSQVFLNTSSIIEVAYSQGFRNIKLLRGEALFEVAKDPTRPFRVYVDGSVVEALGTAFLIRLHDQEVDIAVTHGVVKLTEKAQLESPSVVAGLQSTKAETVLREGQTAHIIEASQTPVVAQVEKEILEKKTAWRNGLIVFESDPLEHVINEVARYMPQTIVISDPELRVLEMGGVFRTGELEPLLLALENSLNLEVNRVRDDLIYLKRKN